jgi:hypothetical protein
VHQDDDVRDLGLTLGSATLGIGIGLVILSAGFWVSAMTLPSNTVVASRATAAATLAPTSAASARPTTSAGPAATPQPSPTRTPSPTPAPTLGVSAFQGQNLRLAALTMPAGYTFTSPVAGKVTVALYQFIDGSVRTGTAVDDLPTFPYIFVTASDREVKIRPGALDKDVKLLVKDGDIVGAGQALFTTLTDGPSSWRTFYDANVRAQVVASAIALPSGNEIDPVPVFRR